MTRLWTSGAELQTATIGIEFSAIVTNAPAIETGTKRSGNAAFRIASVAGAEGFSQIHTAAQGAFFGRFYLYIVAMPTAAQITIAGWRQTGTQKINLRLTSGGALQLFNQEDGAQVGSDSAALSTATWYRIEMAYDSTTLASTTCSARIDGVEFASGTIDITNAPNRLTIATTSSDATLDYIVDDLAINDSAGSFENTWPGEGEVIVLRPNGNGASSQFVGSDGNSTDNYLLVDETPPDSADYVGSGTLNEVDDYALEATPAAMDSGDTINWVGVGVYAAVDDITSTDPDIVLRLTSSGTTDETATLDCNSLTYHGPAPLPALDNYIPLGNDSNYQQPGTATAWTKATLDAATAGVRVSAGPGGVARIAALWVMVDHKPGAGGGGVTYDETELAESPAVAGGADQSVFSDAAGARSPAVAAGADQSVFIDLAGAQMPAVAGAADQSVFSEGGQGTSTAQAGGASVYIQRGREGGTQSPAVGTGADQSVFAENAEAQSPVVAGGADTVTYTEQGAGYSPAAAAGLDQLVYTETATATATAQAGGASQHILAATGDTGGAASPAVAGGADRAVFTEQGAGASAASAGGVVQHIRSGGASSGSWVPFGDFFAGVVGPEVTYGKSLKDRMKREQAEQPALALEDEALLMLL